MTQKNVAPATDDDLHVVAGEGMELDQEPSKDETKVIVEDTTQKNEVEASDKSDEDVQTQKTEAGGDAKHSSKIISDLGEDRKRLAGELIDLARTSETATEKVKELMISDPKMERLIKTKFGKDYDRIMSGEVPSKKDEGLDIKIDLEKIKEQARIEARAEIIMKEAAIKRQQQFDTFAQSSGLNTDEAEQLQDNAELLEPKYGYEKALEMSLLIVNRDKALASKGNVQLPSGGQVSKEPKKTVESTPELEEYRKKYASGRSMKSIVEGLQRVEERLEGNTFHLSD
jgi:hypothetical protein